MDQFPPQDKLVVHFNTPMQPGSSSSPVLVWPGLQGAASWNEAKTTLTFIPDTPLDSKKTYTFFLDPALQSAASKTLKDAPEWVIRVQSAPQIVSVYPSAGEMARHNAPITVNFDREMDTAASAAALTIEPTLPFEMTWKDAKSLEITLKTPLENNTHYDLTLSGLRAADGATLDDYRWFYNSLFLNASLENDGANAIKLKFNQALNQEKSGFPFAVAKFLSCDIQCNDKCCAFVYFTFDLNFSL